MATVNKNGKNFFFNSTLELRLALGLSLRDLYKTGSAQAIKVRKSTIETLVYNASSTSGIETISGLAEKIQEANSWNDVKYDILPEYGYPIIPTEREYFRGEEMPKRDFSSKGWDKDVLSRTHQVMSDLGFYTMMEGFNSFYPKVPAMMAKGMKRLARQDLGTAGLPQVLFADRTLFLKCAYEEVLYEDTGSDLYTDIPMCVANEVMTGVTDQDIFMCVSEAILSEACASPNILSKIQRITDEVLKLTPDIGYTSLEAVFTIAVNTPPKMSPLEAISTAVKKVQEEAPDVNREMVLMAMSEMRYQYQGGELAICCVDTSWEYFVECVIEELPEKCRPAARYAHKVVEAHCGDIDMVILPKSDKLNLTIGEVTDCCQKLGGYGEAVCTEGWIDPHSINYVFKKDGKIVSHMWTWISTNGDFVIDSVEAPGYGDVKNIASCIASIVDMWDGNVVLGTTSYGITDGVRRRLIESGKISNRMILVTPQMDYSYMDVKGHVYVIQ